MAAEQITVSVRTLAGAEHNLSVSPAALVRHGKEAAAQVLGHPSELQRWISDLVVLNDDEALVSSTEHLSDVALRVLCVFLPPTFKVRIKVISFNPGEEAKYVQEAWVTVTPSMTVAAVTDEVAFQCGFAASNKAIRLVHGGLVMLQDRTLEQYLVEPGSTLHVIVPSSVAASSAMPDSPQAFVKDAALEKPSLADDASQDPQNREINSSHICSGIKEDINSENSCKNYNSTIQNTSCTAASFRTPRRCATLRRSVSTVRTQSGTPGISSNDASRNVNGGDGAVHIPRQPQTQRRFHTRRPHQRSHRVPVSRAHSMVRSREPVACSSTLESVARESNRQEEPVEYNLQNVSKDVMNHLGAACKNESTGQEQADMRSCGFQKTCSRAQRRVQLPKRAHSIAAAIDRWAGWIR